MLAAPTDNRRYGEEEHARSGRYGVVNAQLHDVTNSSHGPTQLNSRKHFRYPPTLHSECHGIGSWCLHVAIQISDIGSTVPLPFIFLSREHFQSTCCWIYSDNLHCWPIQAAFQVTGHPDIMKHYCAKPSAQLPKYMHILHCCYKLADNHPTLFQLHIY